MNHSLCQLFKIYIKIKNEFSVSLCQPLSFSPNSDKDRQTQTDRQTDRSTLKTLAFHKMQVNQVITDQKIVGNSLQPIDVIITGNLFIKAPC